MVRDNQGRPREELFDAVTGGFFAGAFCVVELLSWRF